MSSRNSKLLDDLTASRKIVQPEIEFGTDYCCPCGNIINTNKYEPGGIFACLECGRGYLLSFYQGPPSD